MNDLPRKHGSYPYLAAEAYSLFVAPGKIDGHALPRAHRMNELGRSDLIRAEVFPEARFDRAQRLAQQERPGDDWISREMPLCGSVPVSLRGRDSTKQSGRGRNAASIRWRRAAMMVSLASPGATTKAVSRVTVPSSSSGMTNVPSRTPSMEFR